MMASYMTVASPVGPLTIAAEEGKIVRVSFGAESAVGVSRCDNVLLEADEQLKAYFAGQLRRFSLPLAPAGTEFQKKVWTALEGIPYGGTRTYGEIAAAVGNPRACRAVGMANHANPIAIIIPCHRVVGAGGRLTGYAGGIDKKAYLLELERERNG